MTSSRDVTTLAAFVAFVVIAGANAVGVKYVLLELAPFWGAAFRFAVAGLLLLGLALAMRKPLPRGERLLGTLLYGGFGTGLSYLFLYWGLQEAPAGTTMLVLAVVPLLTVLLAVVEGVERFRRLGFIGALIAAAGIVVVAADQLTLAVPLPSLLALLAGAACIAQSGVAAKRFPPGDPVPANAIGMLFGAALVGVAALVAGDPLVLPTRPEVWAAMLYLILPGSVLLFILVLYILARWTASATAYGFLLFPLVAIALGSVMLNEPIQPAFLLGGVIVVAGVYVGAIYRPRASGASPEPRPAEEAATARS